MASKPDRIASSATRTANVLTNVRIAWDPTPNERDSAVIAYRVLIRQKDGLFSQELLNCDGTSLAVVSSRSCFIPMDILRADPFWLVEGDLVVATIEALNEIGYSDVSAENT